MTTVQLRQGRRLQKHARGTGAAFVYASMKRAIFTLELKPGQLLDETELSRRYQVSRSPVREALIRLAGEGLITTLPNRCSIVSVLDLPNLIDYFDAVDLLYRLTARRAAVSATQDDLAEIEAAAAAHSEAAKTDDVDAVIESNLEFHVAIARASHNSYFVNWTRSLLESGRRIQHLYWRELAAKLSDDIHDTIVGAIRAADANAAEIAARKDAVFARNATLSLFQRQSDELNLDASAA